MQAKDIPDQIFLSAIENVARRKASEGWAGMTEFRYSTGRYDGGPWVMRDEAEIEIESLMRCAVPSKVVLAKYRQLEKRELVDGCGCGCRGDWQVIELKLKKL